MPTGIDDFIRCMITPQNDIMLHSFQLTSTNLCKLIQTFVPLMTETCRSEVSPPNMTNTFWTSPEISRVVEPRSK